MGLFALALPFLTWWQAALCALAAFVFNWLVLPRLLGHRLTSARKGVSDRGVLLYPLVVLALILLFRHQLYLAAFGWGVLAFGDSAAGVVGQKWGRHPLPWNPKKTWEGLAAFVVGSLAAVFLLVPWVVLPRVAAHTLGLSQRPTAIPGLSMFTLSPLSWPLPHFVVIGLIPVALAALLESLPHGLDDNVLPPFVAACLLFTLQPEMASGRELAMSVGVTWILGVNTACAALAWVTRALRPGGIVAAWLLGVVTAVAFGVQGFTLLLAFLLAGLGATFVGYRRKRSAGVAESHGGRRGAAEVLGKGGILLASGLQLMFAGARRGDFTVLGWVVTATLAAALADTWGTEFGGLWGKRAFTLWPLRQAAPGTSGAVSIPGLIALLVGAAAISALGVALGLLGEAPTLLAVLCTVAAFVATLVESILPRLGEASHVGKNLVVTLLAPLLVFAVLGVIR